MAVLNRFCAGLKAKRDTPARKGKEGGLDPLPSFPTGAIVELLCVASTLIFCFLFVSGGERAVRPFLVSRFWEKETWKDDPDGPVFILSRHAFWSI